MFRWYARSEICYVFLSDVFSWCRIEAKSQLHKSRWFTRGWTLQELITPHRLSFYTSNWTSIGSRNKLRDRIAFHTGVGANLLRDNITHIHRELNFASITQRMSWVVDRHITRGEDLAYSLLEIFDIHMPLLYGEGKQAFIRLQEEIIRHNDDHSIFAWTLCPPSILPTPASATHTGMLASSPSLFAGSGDVVSVETGEDSRPFYLTNRGI